MGQNLNTAAQPTALDRPSQPVAQFKRNSNNSNIANKLSTASISEGTLTDILAAKGPRESKVNQVGSFESLLDSPVQGAKKRQDWRLPKLSSGQEDKLKREGKRGTLHETPLTRSKGYNNNHNRDRTQDMTMDIDSILSDIGSTSSKKKNRCRMLIGR